MLIVYDNLFDIVAITTMFQQYQIETDTATDGPSAVEKVKQLYREHQRTYNLIMMDYIDPLSCNNATKEIRKFIREEAPGAK